MSDLAAQLQIDTPENVLLDAEVAGFGSRCIAAMLDYLILAATLLLLYWILQPIINDRGNSWAAGLYVLVQFVLVWFYHFLFEILWNGQTPGKRMLGLRVVGVNGLPITSSAALIRNLVRLFDFAPLLYVIGLISLFATKNTQRLGDLAARTVVIRERGQVSLANIRENFAVQYAHIAPKADLPPGLSIDALTDEDRRDVVNYLQRRAQLIRREYVVVPLAVHIAKRMSYESIAQLQSPKQAEVFLEQVARLFEMAAVRASAPILGE